MPQNTIVRQAATALVVTPSDGTAIVGASFNSPAALFVGTGGNINVITLGGSTVLLKNIANGTFLPVQVTHVKATDITATDIVALF